MSWSIDFHADDRKVTVDVDWAGPGDYRLLQADGATTSLGTCNTAEEMLNALLDADWSPDLEGARVEQASS